VTLSNHLLGKTSGLQLHHVFRRACCTSTTTRERNNALANFTFLTQTTNLEISDKPPAEYLPGYIEKHPGAVESHWLPTDPELWKVENYEAFLEERRTLLAAAANGFLDNLFSGRIPEPETPVDALAAKAAVPLGASHQRTRRTCSSTSTFGLSIRPGRRRIHV